MIRGYCNFLWLVCSVAVFGSDGWPQYLGPNRDGTAVAPGLFDGQVSLERLWIRPLGSGFSGVVVGGGKVYTMHAEFEKDALSCFEADTGKLLWSFHYGVAWPKVGGSQPGPLSTPVIDGDRVYGLGGRGELFCLETKYGHRVWVRDLVKELGAVQPWCGMTTSPLISDGLLILNLGDGKDKGIAAFNKMTGELAWHLGEEKITFHSPALMTLKGRRQVVALSETKMLGLDPATGQVIWEHRSEDWIQTIAIGEDRFLSGRPWGFVLHQLDDQVGEPKLKEVWKNHNLNLEYDMPVHHKGYLYGFKGYYVTCLKLETGEVVWQSPVSGSGRAILVDGHLASFCNDGNFRIARVSEKGYEERATLRFLSKGGFTEPSFAHGVFYLRNHSYLAAVRVN